VTISQTATDVRARARQGLFGQPAVTGTLLSFLSMINEDPQAVQSDEIVVDTATNDHEYTLDFNGIEVSYTADGSATKIEVAAGIAAAINAEPAVRGQVAAVSDGVDTVTTSGLTPGVAYTLENVDSKLTATPVATAAEADPIPFGRLCIDDGLHPDGDGTRLGKLCQASAFTAQEATVTVTYQAGAKYAIMVKNAATGEILADVLVDADTNDDTTATAIEAALAAALPANTVDEAVLTNVVTLTAEIAGFEFSVETSIDTSGAAAVVAETTGPDATTSLHRAAVGVSMHSIMDEAATIGAEQGEYPANHGFRAFQKGPIWMERPGAVSNGDPVFVELAAGDNAGRFYDAVSATRVQLATSRATWERDGRTPSDNLAVARLNLA
jgi:hypothetical protein